MKELTNQSPVPNFLDNQKLDVPKPKNVMGKDDFMKLLMTQLQNQDPMKPMDAHEFASQLAQFSQMEQLTNIGKGIEGLRSGQGDDSKLQALQLIGRKILATGRDFELKDGQQAVSLSHNLKPDVHPTKAIIFDASGKTVREIELSKTESASEIVWDGKDKDGLQSPPGRYTFRVQGQDSSGQTQESGNELAGRVLGLEMTTKGPMLVVQTGAGNTKIELSKVKEVAVDDSVGGAPAPVASPTSPVANKIIKAPMAMLQAKPEDVAKLEGGDGKIPEAILPPNEEGTEAMPSDDDRERFTLPLASSGYLRP